MSSIAGGKRIASNMAGQPSSSLYDLYYGGYDEDEPLDEKEGSGEGQQDEADLNPSVLLGSKKRSKLQKYRASLQSQGYLSRTRQKQSPLPVENLPVQEDEEEDDDEVQRDAILLNPNNNPDPKPVDEEVVVLDEEAKKRRLNTARWKAIMEDEKSDEEDEEEDEDDDEVEDEDEEDNHEKSRQNDSVAKVPDSNLPDSGAKGKNVVDEPPTSNVAEDHLRVKIKNKSGKNIVVKIRPKQNFKKLFAAWQKIAVDKGWIDSPGAKVKFLFDGVPLREADTPELLGIEDEDIIEVYY